MQEKSKPQSKCICPRVPDALVCLERDISYTLFAAPNRLSAYCQRRTSSIAAVIYPVIEFPCIYSVSMDVNREYV